MSTTELQDFRDGDEDQILDLATAVIRSYCGWSITQEEDVVYTVPTWDEWASWYTWRRRIWLPTLYLTAVSAVTSVDDATVVDLTFTTEGLIEGLLYEDVLITYTHGYVTVPDDIKAVTMQVAARYMTNPDAVRSESVGTYSVTYNGESLGIGLASSETAILDNYRLRPRL